MRQDQETAIAAERTVDYYRQALAIDPTSFNAHYGLALCYLRRPDHLRDAEEHSRGAIDAEPASAVARLGLGEVLVASERWDAAVQQLERATQLEPTLREAHFLLGRAYRGLGLRDNATRALEAARALQQKEAEAFRQGVTATGSTGSGVIDDRSSR